MKAERPEGPQEPRDRKKQRSAAARPKRVGGTGPLGFGSVMRDVRGGAAADPAAQQAARLDAGAQAAAAMGAVPTAAEHVADNAFGVRSAEDALQAQDRAPQQVVRGDGTVATQLGRMAPAALLTRVVDEATKQAIAEASRELHVELEPAHLGPLVIRLMRGRDGQLDIRFRAREGDAVRVLEAGTEELRERLAAAGMGGARIDVELDPDTQVGAGSTPAAH